MITSDIDGNPVAPIITAADGFYQFTNLRPGGYKVRFLLPDPPPAYQLVTPKAGADDTVDSDAFLQGDGSGLTQCTTLASGESNPDLDAGLARIAESRLGDFVWQDLDADGIQDDGEPGIPDVEVELWLCDAQGLPDTDTGRRAPTSAAGLYLFDGLVAGSYAVRFPVETLAGLRVSPQNAGGDDARDSDADPVTGFSACTDLGVADQDLTLDAGFFRPASLGDLVWDDDSVARNDLQDRDGQGTVLEAGVDGARVTLEDCDGNPVTADLDGDPIGAIITGTAGFENGFYTFDNLRPGRYKVRFAPPPGFRFVTPAVGGDLVDSDALVQSDGTGLSRCVTLESGERNPDIDAGLARIAQSRLGDFVWEDLDADGIQDDGEPGIPNVEVELWLCDGGGNPAADTGSRATTNGDGLYVFDDLVAGRYAVRFPVEELTGAGFRVSPRDEGADDARDSDADPVTGFSACVDLGVADEDLTLDAGFFRPAAIGDFVWDDDSVARNDLQDAGEVGVDGTVVTLEDCFGNPVATDVDGNPVAAITTGQPGFENGFYAFSNLRPGGYRIRFVPPAEYEFVIAGAGAGNVDSDALAQSDGSGLSACVTLASGETNPDVDAGLFLRAVCDVTVEKTCAIVPPPQTEAFVCSDAKPLDELTMRLAADTEIAQIAVYRDKFDPNNPLENLIQVLPGPFTQGQDVTAFGYAAANAKNDVDWVITFANGDTAVSRFHRSCSDAQMNGPEDCGLPQGDGKDDDAGLANIWALEGMAGNGLALDCTAPDPTPSTATACEFSTPAPPHCQGKVEAITFRYVDGDCVIAPNDQEGRATCVVDGAAGEPVRIVVSDGGSKIYLDTGAPGSVGVGDVLTATAASAGETQFASNSLIEIFSETGDLLQEVEFHTSCSKPLNLGDRFGSLVVLGLDTTEGGSASLGAEVRYDYRFTNNAGAPFTGYAVDDQLGVLLDPLVLGPAPESSSVETVSRTVFVLPGDDNVTINTAAAFASDDTLCGSASASVTRVPPPPPPPAPVSCSDIKPLSTLSLLWSGPSGVDVVTAGGEIFRNLQTGNVITFGVAGLGNDVGLTLTGAVSGQSFVHVSCSDAEMNGSEDCGKAQGNNKGDDPDLVNDWRLEGMQGEGGGFRCDLPESTGEVTPEVLNGGTGDVVGARNLDLGDDKKVKWDLTNTNGLENRVVAEVLVTWPGEHGQLKKAKLDGDTFADNVFDAASPTALPAEGAFASDAKKRTLKPEETRTLTIEFDTAYQQHTALEFSITVVFEGGDRVTFNAP